MGCGSQEVVSRVRVIGEGEVRSDCYIVVLGDLVVCTVILFIFTAILQSY
jgi:hypothetical protein